jgi:diguanylate cyclase (GGDEF)-like protein/PAS domain S-box-containing protein
MSPSKVTESVLIIDATESVRKELTEPLRRMNFVVLVARDMEKAERYFREANPVMVFLDLMLPEPESEGVLQFLAKESPDTPVILVHESQKVPECIGAYSLDAYDVLVRPVDAALLGHVARRCRFNARLLDAAQAHIRYLERRNVSLDVRIHDLEARGTKLIRENMEYQHVDRANRKEIRSQMDTERHLRFVQVAIDKASDPILVLRRDSEVVYFNDAFAANFGEPEDGADGYDTSSLFVDPEMGAIVRQNVETLGQFSCEVPLYSLHGFDVPTLVSATAIADSVSGETGALYIFSDITEQEELRKEAYHDALTGLYSRRHFMNVTRSAMSGARRHGQALSLCLCDLDKFKEVNDTYGHRAGDEVLVAFCRIVQKELRTEDVSGRIGGDEFCVVFPNITAADAANSLERIRKIFEATEFTADDGATFSCSATFGVADLPDDEVNVEQFVELADKSLYKAKEHGRDCVVANMELVETSGEE